MSIETICAMNMKTTWIKSTSFIYHKSRNSTVTSIRPKVFDKNTVYKYVKYKQEEYQHPPPKGVAHVDTFCPLLHLRSKRT